MLYRPGPNFGYRVVEIDGHPWDYLLTMKELVQLEPGSIVFTGPAAEEHESYWKEERPDLFHAGKDPVFKVDTLPVNPHSVETKPKRPFQPWIIR